MNRNTTEQLTRRQALGMLGATAFAASAMAAPACAAAQMKIGCGTVTFRKSSLAEAFERIRRAGYQYVEPQATGPTWCPHVDVWKDDPQTFVKLVRDAGFLGVTAMWAPKGAIISNPECVEGITQAIRWAKEAGIPVINAGDGRKPPSMSDDDALKLLGQRMAQILEVAEKSQVYLAIEPHGTFSTTADGLKKLLSLSKSKWLGINYDTANVHHAEQDEVATLRAIADRVVHVHVKDSVSVKVKDKVKHECVALGKGEVNVLGCLLVLKEHGYSGALSLETEGEFGPDEGQGLIEASRTWLTEAVASL